jgi:LPS export ABC transporter protein LptC
MNKKLIFFIPIILIGIIIGYNYLSKNSEESLFPEEAIDEVVDDVVVDEPPVNIEKGTVIGIKNEKKEWMIESGSVEIAKDRKRTVFSDVKEMVIFKDDQPELDVNAKEFIADMQTKNIEFIGEVVITNTNGDVLHGEHFYWDSIEQKLISWNSVDIEFDEMNITAGNLSTNIEMDYLVLQEGVKVRMKL